MKTTLELVHDLQRLLSGPEKWCQGVFSTDAYHTLCPSRSPCACRWCFFGAIDRVSRSILEAGILSQLADLAHNNGGVGQWQDAPERTFADIQALMAKMEELAKDQP